MITQAQANALLGQYAPRIATLLGGAVPSNLRVVVMPAAEYAAKYPNTGAYSLADNVIAIPDNTPDPTRIIAYEAAHQMAAGPGVGTTMGEHGLRGNKAGKASEALAGVITNKLGLTPPGWQPDARQARFMNLNPAQLKAVGQDLESGSYSSIRESIGGPTGGSPQQYPGEPPAGGPQPQGTTTGRNRNQGQGDRHPGAPQPPGGGMPTGGSVPVAQVSPEQAVAYAGQLAALRNTFLTQLAENKFGVRSAVLAGKTAKAGITAERNAGLSQQENAAAGAGRLGGSYDLGQRTGIVAGAAQAQIANQQTVLNARQAGMFGNMQAENAYETGIYGVASEQAAAQASAQADALKNGLFDPQGVDYDAIYAAVRKRWAARQAARGNVGTRQGTGGSGSQGPGHGPPVKQTPPIWQTGGGY